MFGSQEQKKINPVSKFFDWKSDKENKTGTFKSWDKETKTETASIPSEFILLSQVSCIKWWDDKSGSGIYSNEVVSTKNEDLVVRAFKSDTPLFEGKYDRDTIEGLWWVFHKGLIVLEGTNIHEYYLKGWALFQWNEDVNKIDTENYKIKIDKIVEKKKWAVTYYVPTWKQWSKITEEDRSVALEMVRLLEEYRSND